MENKRIEENLITTIEAIKPDQLKKIMRDAKKTTINPYVEAPKHTHLYKKLVPVLMAALLVIGSFTIYSLQNAQTVAAKVILEVNPSIELQINPTNKVVKAMANNEDGQKIIGDMDLTGSDVKVAVNALIGSMVKNGYISEMANSILISVDSNNSAKAKQLSNELTVEVNQLLDGTAAILTQTLEKNNEITLLSQEKNISSGKAQLIKEIADNNPLYTVEDLSELSINELNLLNKQKTTDKLSSTGTASQQGYIGAEKALEIALTKAGVAKADAYNIEVELDFEHHVMVYVVEFDSSGFEYEFDINATTGEIIVFGPNNTNTDKPASSNSNNTSSSSTNYISGEEAKQIAFAHAGVSSSSVRDLELDLDMENGKMVYEVSFESGNYEFDYEIEATTGAIIKHEKEYND